MDLIESQKVFEDLSDSRSAFDNLARVEDEAGIGLVQGDGGVQISALQRLLDQDVTLFRRPCGHGRPSFACVEVKLIAPVTVCRPTETVHVLPNRQLQPVLYPLRCLSASSLSVSSPAN